VAFGHFIGISKFNAALVILCGIATVSLPWVFDSSFFPWVVGVTLAVIGLEVTVVLWKKMTTKPVEAPATQDQPQPQPEDQPKE